MSYTPKLLWELSVNLEETALAVEFQASRKSLVCLIAVVCFLGDCLFWVIIRFGVITYNKRLSLGAKVVR